MLDGINATELYVKITHSELASVCIKADVDCVFKVWRRWNDELVTHLVHLPNWQYTHATLHTLPTQLPKKLATWLETAGYSNKISCRRETVQCFV